jgi:protein-S-isoprenylcysteine O-methyltransferase Ste14
MSSFVLVVLDAALRVPRAGIEERILLTRGEAFRAYPARTPFFFPRLF